MTTTMWPITFFSVILLYTSSSVVQGGTDRVKLSDIKALTLTNGYHTNGRRSSGVPQLKCLGGSAGCKKWAPTTVLCTNMGSNGHDIQWKCESEMPNKYKFGEIFVTCEGYDHPNDPHVLSGSCGLEYKLEYSGSEHSQYYGKSKYDTDSKSSFGSWFVIVGIIVIAVGIFKSFIKQAHTPNHPTTGGDPYSGARAPPAPGFRSDFFPDQANNFNDCGTGSQPFAGTRNRNAGSGLGGFWTGAATGGLLGYMMGSNTSQGHNQRYGFQTPDYDTNSRSSSTFSSYSSSSDGGGSRTSSGYGGTKRR